MNGSRTGQTQQVVENAVSKGGVPTSRKGTQGTHSPVTRPICYSGKQGFRTQKEAEHSGMRAYKCFWCHYYHRTGKCTEIRNPVIR